MAFVNHKVHGTASRVARAVTACALAIAGTGFTVWLRGCGTACVDGLVVETLLESLAATTVAVLAGRELASGSWTST